MDQLALNPDINTPLQVGFFIVDGFSMMCFANAVEPLRAANMISGQNLFHRSVITPDGKAVTSSSNLSLLSDGAPTEDTKLDWLFVITSYDYQKQASKATLSSIRQMARNAKMVIGLDTGSWLLAKAGLLNNHLATLHWQALDVFAEKFASVEVSDNRYVIDNRRASAGGATATLDLMLELIRRCCGESLFIDVHNLFIYDVRQPANRRQQPFSLFAQTVPRLYKAIRLMEQSIENPLSLVDISNKASTTMRSLNRLFKHHIGMTPGHYYLDLRLKAARRLIAETSLSMTEIALRCGFNSPQVFCRAFRQKYDTSPRRWRSGRMGKLS